MKKIAIFCLPILISLLLVACLKIPNKTYPSVNPTFERTTVNALLQENSSSKNVTFVGYVLAIDSCPSCPLFSQCKMCGRKGIIVYDDIGIYDQKKIILHQQWSIEDWNKYGRFFIHTKTPEQFQVDKKYTFSIEYNNKDQVRYVRLLGYDAVELDW